MRNKRTFVGVALLIAVLMLGVGYALVGTRTLQIGGDATASPDDTNFIVEFDQTDEKKPTGSAGVTAAVTDKDSATIEVTGLTTVGDEATATYTINNNSNGIDATLSATTSVTGTNADFFSVSCAFGDTTLEAGKSTTVTVTVRLEKTPVDGNKTATVGVDLTATAVNN